MCENSSRISAPSIATGSAFAAADPDEVILTGARTDKCGSFQMAEVRRRFDLRELSAPCPLCKKKKRWTTRPTWSLDAEAPRQTTSTTETSSNDGPEALVVRQVPLQMPRRPRQPVQLQEREEAGTAAALAMCSRRRRRRPQRRRRRRRRRRQQQQPWVELT